MKGSQRWYKKNSYIDKGHTTISVYFSYAVKQMEQTVGRCEIYSSAINVYRRDVFN